MEYILGIFRKTSYAGVTVSAVLQPIIGLSQGIFVGCLAVSLAEALNATAIFARRVKLRIGLSYIILAVAVGKVTAAIIQFTNGWVKK